MGNKLVAIAVAVLAIIAVPILFAHFGVPPARPVIGPAPEETSFEEVRFVNPDQRLQLAGMLFWPDGPGPFPAVVVIHGSGGSHRDNPWYLSIATGLQAAGIVVLLPDKRGSERSEGDWHDASFEALSGDTEAAIALLRDEYSQRVLTVGVLGASQGGQVVPIVASKPGAVDFAIDVVGSAMPFHDALVYEERYNLRQMGILPGLADVLARLTAWHIRSHVQKSFWDAVGNYDPLPYWRHVEVPSLILLGSEDTNTDTARSAQNLEALGKANLEVIVWPGSGHALEDPADTRHRRFRADALAALVRFIRAVGSSPDRASQQPSFSR